MDAAGNERDWNFTQTPAEQLEAVLRCYPRLYALAATMTPARRGTPTNGATALTGRLAEQLCRQDTGFKDDEHLMALATTLMKRIAVDDHRRRAAKSRGAGDRGTTLSHHPERLTSDRTAEESTQHRVAASLEQLRQLFPDEAEVATLKLAFDAPLSLIAQQLGRSDAAIEADWRLARAWLIDEIGPEFDPSSLP